MNVHNLFQMLCTNPECLCWMATILDLSEHRTFAMVGSMGIFNCGHESYKRLLEFCQTVQVKASDRLQR